MTLLCRLLLPAIIMAGIALPALAQVNLNPERFSFETNLNYTASVPSPAQFLGYELGTEYTIYHQAVAYFTALAEASRRVTIGSYGQTYERRPLVYLVITSEANQQNIKQIQADNLKLANPAAISSGEADRLIESLPVITSFSYNIHGNEPSTTEAALQVAYRLAAGNDAATLNALNNSVVVMYPCINPDGRDRYVYWYKTMQRNVAAPEPEDIEHHAPWPLGRTNHYWFDLNRDWIWGVHPESRGHTATYQQWLPQVHTDYHEQGYHNNYFTMPGTTPRNHLLPNGYEALTDTFGMANVAAFDRLKVNYFTREAFDFWYPGYGSSYPSINGAVGMLTEQGGISGGRVITANDGYQLTLRQRLFDHYTTSMATIMKAVQRRQLLRRYTFNARSPQKSKSNTKAYILPDNPNSHLYDVLGMLMHHGVQVTTANAAFEARATDYRTGQQVQKRFGAGTYIISTNQAAHLFVNSIMARNMEIEDSVTYDMSSWSAPLAYNLDAYTTTQPLKVGTTALTDRPTYPAEANFSGSPYAYVIDWQQRNAPRALAMLHQMGYKVRAATKAFGDGTTNWAEGTLIVLAGRNLTKAPTMAADMTTVAQQAKVTIQSYQSGRMRTGIDLASRSTKPLKAPKVALLTGTGTSMYTAGQIYFLLDQELAYPVTRVTAGTLQQTDIVKTNNRYGAVDLNKFDVLILPGMQGRNIRKILSEATLEQLKTWVRAGGVLVATESAASYLTKNESGFTDIELVTAPKDSSTAAKYLSFKDREKYFGLKRIPGAALNGVLDTSHPLAFGMPNRVYGLKFGTNALKPNAQLQSPGYFTADAGKLLVAGYASQQNLNLLAGQTFAGRIPMGDGSVVLLTDNTQYRMFWRGPTRLLVNAIFMVPD